jgi:DNA-binding NarL/FixJ family response regulator
MADLGGWGSWPRLRARGDPRWKARILKTILERGSECGLVGESEYSAEAVQLYRKSRPDIVLMDIGFPGNNDIEATSALMWHCLGIKVIVRSIYDDGNSAIGAIGSSARGCVRKVVSSAELLDALRTVARGGSYLSSRLSDRLAVGLACGDKLDANSLG